MNTIYKISVENVDYDEFDSFVVVAKNEKGIYDEIREAHTYGSECNLPFMAKEKTIERIGITTLRPQVIEASFNAG